MTKLAQLRGAHPRRICRLHRQLGGETVEFALFLIPFFLVCFLIIDMAVVMFNQSVVNQAARYGVRQGTLFWVDPADYDPFDPRGNIRVKESMILSAMTFYENNVLIRTSTGSIEKPVNLQGADTVSGTSPNRTWGGVSEAAATVEMDYDHNFIAVNRLLTDLGIWTLDADTGLRTEADL